MIHLTSTVRYLSVASLLAASATARALALDERSSTEALGERFSDFLSRVNGENTSAAKDLVVHDFVRRVKNYGRVIIEDSTVYFLYYGDAKRVSVPGDLNGWSPTADSMSRIAETNLFFLKKAVDRAARFEYKIAVDSQWILDPLNKQQALGGYGPNSEVWMPGYAPPQECVYRGDVPHGSLDSLKIKSALLRRTHPVLVYLPPGYKKSRQKFPVIYVTDGGEYITLGLMLNVLDNLIAEQRIPPIIGVFVDPRTNIRDSRSSQRLVDYAMSDAYVKFLVDEVRPKITRKYRLIRESSQTAIMGASLGGLISTYAAYRHPEVFGMCAAQSPAYHWNHGAIIDTLSQGPTKPVKFYIDTGIIHDAHPDSRKMKRILEEKGYPLKYAEYPEGHNWVNWRARIPAILQYFWGAP